MVIHSPLRYITFVALTLLLNGCNSASPTTSTEVAIKGLHSAALSDNGEYAVVGSIQHGGSFWHNQTQERLYNWNHQENQLTTIVAADLSHGGEWALTANPYDLVLWNTASGKGERFWKAPGEILDAELGPNANTAILGLSDHTAVIFNIQRGGILRTFKHKNRVRSVDFNIDGTLALTGSEDYTVSLWKVSSGEKLSTFKHDDDVQLVKLSPDGEIALSVSKYDRALLWETSTGNPLGEIPLQSQYIKRGVRFTCARFSDDNSLLLTGRPDQFVDLWDVATRKRLMRWKLPKRNAWKPTGAAVLDVSFSQDKRIFYAVASNGFVHTLQHEP